jgi:hypothetical protein
VPNAAYAQVAEFLANFRKLQEMLNEICAINAELLRRPRTLLGSKVRATIANDMTRFSLLIVLSLPWELFRTWTLDSASVDAEVVYISSVT